MIILALALFLAPVHPNASAEDFANESLFNQQINEVFEQVGQISGQTKIGPAIPTGSPQINADLGDKSTHLFFSMRKAVGNGSDQVNSETFNMVETAIGMVAKLVQKNDKPLADKDLKKENKRLSDIMRPGQPRENDINERQQQMEKIENMWTAFHDAFIFHLIGEDGSSPEKLLRYSFDPNPNFHPTMIYAIIYPHLKGSVWVRSSDKHIVKVVAQLFEDADFARGILGKVYSGGQFTTELSNIAGKRWAITHMKVDVTVRQFYDISTWWGFGKSKRIVQDLTATNFATVPSNLTYEQGLELLQKGPVNSFVGN